MRWLVWVVRAALVIVVFLVLFMIFALNIGAFLKTLVAIGLYFFGTVSSPEKISWWLDSLLRVLGILKE